jgi:adenosylcobinamide kinase / adenosylcobinamide-phosphate guanylyltransferase
MFRRALVLGGARSGKSLFAERLASERGDRVLYVATATATDEEMAQRIAHHRARRPSAWRTVEAPTEVAARSREALQDLAQAAGEASTTRTTILVEDLTLLLSNLFVTDETAAEARAVEEVDAILRLETDLILVSNEVGMGLVPEYPLGRHFRDALGRINQHTAAVCAEVYLIVAGLPLRLK